MAKLVRPCCATIGFLRNIDGKQSIYDFLPRERLRNYGKARETMLCNDGILAQLWRKTVVSTTFNPVSVCATMAKFVDHVAQRWDSCATLAENSRFHDFQPVSVCASMAKLVRPCYATMGFLRNIGEIQAFVDRQKNALLYTCENASVTMLHNSASVNPLSQKNKT